MARRKKHREAAAVGIVPPQTAEEAHAHLRKPEAPKGKVLGYALAVIFGLAALVCFGLAVNAVRAGAPRSESGFMIGFGVFWCALSWLFVKLPNLKPAP